MLNIETLFIDGVKANLKAEKAKYASGEIKWNVSNQFNESVIDSALAVVEALPAKEILDKVADISPNITPMDLARLLSTFDEPEIDSAWID